MATWQEPKTFAIWLTIALLIVIFMASSIILLTRTYYKRIMQEQHKLVQVKLEHQQKLLKDSILVQERERNRIAADLHDDLISKLNIILLAGYSNKTELNPDKLLEESIVVARRISHELSPPLLEETSWVELVEDFIVPLSKTYKLKLNTKNISQIKLDKDTKLQLFRIIQEVTNNIVKHAKADQIEIHLRIGTKSIGIHIEDDGIGFDPKTQSKGLGLKNIEFRTQLLKGAYRIKSSPGKGTSFFFIMSNTKLHII